MPMLDIFVNIYIQISVLLHASREALLFSLPLREMKQLIPAINYRGGTTFMPLAPSL